MSGWNILTSRCSRHFERVDIRAIGLKYFTSQADFDLGIGLMLAFFRSLGRTPSDILVLTRMRTGVTGV